ncbi:MAG: hypothetical protein ACLQVG_11880 [Terriglobia bacterium]
MAWLWGTPPHAGGAHHGMPVRFGRYRSSAEAGRALGRFGAYVE